MLIKMNINIFYEKIMKIFTIAPLTIEKISGYSKKSIFLSLIVFSKNLHK